eukprot:6518061-Prymnesium_polylepis.1
MRARACAAPRREPDGAGAHVPRGVGQRGRRRPLHAGWLPAGGRPTDPTCSLPPLCHRSRTAPTRHSLTSSPTMARSPVLAQWLALLTRSLIRSCGLIPSSDTMACSPHLASGLECVRLGDRRRHRRAAAARAVHR